MDTIIGQLGTVAIVWTGEQDVAQDGWPAAVAVRSGADMPLADCFDDLRRQVDADCLLEHIPAAERLTVYITGADIMLPNRAFVFGAAHRARKTALVSTARLGGVASRVRSVTWHELGHLIGLKHCRLDFCIMHQASTATAVDMRIELCPPCPSNRPGRGMNRLTAGRLMLVHAPIDIFHDSVDGYTVRSG